MDLLFNIFHSFKALLLLFIIYFLQNNSIQINVDIFLSSHIHLVCLRIFQIIHKNVNDMTPFQHSRSKKKYIFMLLLLVMLSALMKHETWHWMKATTPRGVYIHYPLCASTWLVSIAINNFILYISMNKNSNYLKFRMQKCWITTM